MQFTNQRRIKNSDSRAPAGKISKHQESIKFPSIQSTIFLLLLLILAAVLSLHVYPAIKLSKISVTSNPRASIPTDDIHARVLVVQESGGYISYPHNATSYADALEHCRGNSGNFVWFYGGTYLIDSTQVQHCFGDRDHCIGLHPYHSKLVYYSPRSYMLIDNYTLQYNHGSRLVMIRVAGIMSKSDEPYYIVGAGTQPIFNYDMSLVDVGAADSIAVGPEDYNLIDEGRNLLQVMQRKKQVAFFRGAFTNAVAKRFGYTYGLETGCPSLMINRDVRLGQSLQIKYDAIAKRIGDKSLKIAINLSKPPRLRQIYWQILREYPNSLIYAQGKNDFDALKEEGIPWDRVRFFAADVPAWIRSIESMDVSFGSRIHGNMVAVSAGVPVFLIAPDHRVLEMAQTMNLPATHLYDERLLEDSIDVASFFAQAQFDGAEFDRNRCRIAREYKKHFNEAGMPLAPHVEKITELC